jgi:endonuclease III
MSIIYIYYFKTNSLLNSLPFQGKEDQKKYKNMKKKDLPFLEKTLNEMYPDAKTELYYKNKFQLLIAILMSAQTTDRQVNKINRNLFEFLKTPKDGVDL